MTKNWKIWLTVFLAVMIPLETLAVLLAQQGLAVLAGLVTWLGRLFLLYWLVGGLIAGREHPWVRRATGAILGSAAAVLAGLFFLAIGSDAGVWAVSGVYGMALMFVVGLALLRLLLSPAWPALGVARTLVDEAIRMKVPLVFIVALALLIPTLPFVLDPAERLSYRLQSFLSWSLMAVSFLLGLMTIFLAVGSISNELRDKQIYLTLTKPVARLQYLAGKWLGVVLLNLLLVSIAGMGIYTFTKVLTRTQARNITDAAAVEEQVLVARESSKPVTEDPQGAQRMFFERLEQLRRDNPVRYGAPGSPMTTLSESDSNEIMQAVLANWYSLPPQGTRVYVFRGLLRAKEVAQTVQLRLEPKAGSSSEDGFVYLRLRVNDRPYFNPVSGMQGVPPLAEGQYHVLHIHTQMIDDTGTLQIAVTNVPGPNGAMPPSISFNAKDGFELLYKVGGFEANLFRGLLLVWLRLIFLAMVGVFASTFLGFPVACLFSLLVYAAAAGSAYLTESFTYYSVFPQADQGVVRQVLAIPGVFIGQIAQGDFYEAFKVVIQSVGRSFMLLIPAFGDYNPTPLLADGRLVSWRVVGEGFWRVGLVWSGLIGLLGWAIFHRKEIARVTV